MAQFVGNELFPSFESSLFPEAELGASMGGAVGGASVTVAQVREAAEGGLWSCGRASLQQRIDELANMALAHPPAALALQRLTSGHLPRCLLQDISELFGSHWTGPGIEEERFDVDGDAMERRFRCAGQPAAGMGCWAARLSKQRMPAACCPNMLPAGRRGPAQPNLSTRRAATAHPPPPFSLPALCSTELERLRSQGVEAPREKADMFFGAAPLDETFSPGEACGGSCTVAAAHSWGSLTRARHGFAAVLTPVRLLSYSVHVSGCAVQH